MALVPFYGASGIIDRVFYYDDITGDLVIRSDVDKRRVNKTLENNKQEASEFRPYSGAEMRKVAEIPVDIAEIWAVERGVDIYTEEGLAFFISNVLSDPEYKYLKTVPSNYTLKSLE